MEYKSDLKSLAIFELKSWLGRSFIDSKPRLKEGENYLNLGCGSNYVDGYVNADFFYRFKFWRKDNQKKQWQLDLRYPLHCADNVFDGIYTEHTIEHLYPDQAMSLFKELYRVLKKDSIIRVTVPDIEKYINFYIGNIDDEEFNKRYTTKCSAIRNITQNYFHVSTWDYCELKKYLEESGFRNIEKKSFNESNDENLKIDLQERSWETLYLEAVK